MKAIAEIQVIPIGVGVSVRKEVKRAHRLLEESGLKIQLHSYGTNVEGELGQIFSAIERVHETLHAEGTVQDRYAHRQGSQLGRQVVLAVRA
jgi:uncharacterized protein (TIGR00106 family)